MQFKFLNQLLRTALLTGIVAVSSLAPALHAAEGDTPPSVEVSSGTGSSLVVVAGEETQISVSANITHDPISNQECTLSGPDWEWSGSGGATVESNDENATLTFTFDTAGDYTVGATAKASYSSNCSGDAGISGSGGISFSVKVVAKNWLTHTDIGKGVNLQGVTVDNGRMTAPQDQTKNPADPAQVFIPLGKEIDVSVEDATDNDKWTLDLNGDGQIDPDPDNGETDVESDTVKYKWSGGGDFTDDELSSTKWKAASVGVYTLTCTIDDEWSSNEDSIDAPDTGNRNDAPITRSIEVVVFSATMKIARQGTGLYQSFTNVAAGAVANGVHQADVLIEVLPVRAGIPISPPDLTNGEGAGGVDAKVVMAAATTNTDGKVFGTFTSSNRTQGVTLTLNTGQSGDQPTVDVNQSWNEDGIPWSYEPFFNYNQALAVSYEPRFKDANLVQTLIPITGHNLSFRIRSAMVYRWDEEEGEYVPEEYEGGDDVSVLYDSELSELVEFDMPQPKTDSVLGGTYTSNLTVHWNLDEIVESVQFRVIDEGTYEGK